MMSEVSEAQPEPRAPPGLAQEFGGTLRIAFQRGRRSLLGTLRLSRGGPGLNSPRGRKKREMGEEGKGKSGFWPSFQLCMLLPL